MTRPILSDKNHCNDAHHKFCHREGNPDSGQMQHDGKFWMFSEGGRKFIGLEKNSHVCLAIYDKYDGFGNLRSLQVTGIAAMVKPFSEEYNTHAAFKKIPLDALKKLPSPMNLICVTPTRIDALFSDFKKDGYSSRQILHQLA